MLEYRGNDMLKPHEIIRAANALSITITKAKPGSEVYQCWADRVEEAWCAKTNNNEERCKELIKDANSYAVQ